MADKEISVKVQDLTKTFKIPLEASNGIKQKVINSLKGRKGYREFSPLKGVSFEIEKGDFFGIVGRNGSGKSTLLKTLAGIYAPNDGLVQVNGKLVPFIELGVGFNPELTGRENVFLNGALLGFSHKQMEEMYDDIVEFAELQDFMEERLKNYSSGMQVRLAFSIAIRADGDVLLLDEVLAVGDEAFQRKCFAYFAELKKNKKTVILVTHSMESVQQFCNKAMMIEKGCVVEYGNPAKVAQQYSEQFLKEEAGEKDKNKPIVAKNNLFETAATVRKEDNVLVLDVSLTPKKDFEDPVVGMIITRDSGEIVWRWASDDDIAANTDKDFTLSKGKKTQISIKLNNILPDAGFTLTVLVRKKDKSEQYAKYTDIASFDNYKYSIYEKFWKMNESVEVSHGK